MKKNQSGFSLLEVLVVILIIGLIGTVGWLVHDRQPEKPSTATTNTAANNPVSTKPAELKGNVSFISANEPSGWVEEHQQGSSIYSLSNSQLGCYVSLGVDKPKADLSGVAPLAGAANREVTLGSGQKVTIYDSGQSKDYLVSEGHIVKSDFNANVAVACKDKANNPTADLALKALRLE